MRSAEEFNEGSDFEIVLRDLQGVSDELRTKIGELQNLYTQDKNNYLGDEEPLLTNESLTLDQAYKLVEEIKSRQDRLYLINLIAVKSHHDHALLLQAARPK